MTAVPSRPNLGALFTGSTPPDRPSVIPAPPVEPTAPPVEPTDSGPRPLSPWLRPAAPVESYFDLLHAIVDANRQFAVMWADPFRLSRQGVGPRR